MTQKGHFVIKLLYFGRDALHLAACYWLWLKMSREIQDAEINKIYIPLREHVFRVDMEKCELNLFWGNGAMISMS